MPYLFNDDKSKVQLNTVLNPILTELEQNYQANVNTMYNACVNAGVTPTAKTPAAIATAIAGVKTKYQNVTWNEQFQITNRTDGDYAIAEIALDDVVSVTFSGWSYNGGNAVMWIHTANILDVHGQGAPEIRHWDRVAAGTVINNFQSNEKFLNIYLQNNAMGLFVITRQTKVLR